MCYKCDGFSETIKIEHSYEYFNLVKQIKVIIEEGTMYIAEGNCNFEDIVTNKPLPEDVLYHEFICSSCERRFSLSSETYHGSGGTWEVIDNMQYTNIDIEKLNVYWNNFVTVCKVEYDRSPFSLKSSLDDLDMPTDVKVVIIFKLGENAKAWMYRCVPVLKYKKPIEMIKTEKGLYLLKSVLLSMPD